MQGQDPRGARLAIRARTEGLTAADVDRCLSEERSLLITWLNRGTLHLVRSEDYPWLHALTTPPLLNESARRLSVEGISAEVGERALARIERALADEGPLTRAQLRERLQAGGAPDRRARRSPPLLPRRRARDPRPRPDGRQAARLRPRPRLARRPAGAVDRDKALAELARRYLVGHAPAGDRDLARWAGLPLRDARAGLKAIASELEEREDGLLQLAGRPWMSEIPPPRLLGAFDPVLLGWTSREDDPRPAHRAGHHQRPLPPLRDGEGARRRDLAVGEGEGGDRASGADREQRPRRPRRRRRRRRAVHGSRLTGRISPRKLTQIARHSRVRDVYPGPMERVAWTGERLDDLSRRMDAGFDWIDRDIRELRAELHSETGSLRAEIGTLRTTMNRVGAGMIVGPRRCDRRGLRERGLARPRSPA